MLKRGIPAAGLALLIMALSAAMPTVPITASTPLGTASECGVVSCTVYLPLIAKPAPPLPAQLEVTQAVQQPNNSVLLVANRSTYVRWTLVSNVGYTNVDAYLYGASNGVSLPGSPLAALNNPRTLSASANRAALNDTFNFQLPTNWATGNVALSAQAYNSTGFFTYTTSASFHFNPSAAMQVKVVPIAYHCISGGTDTVTPLGPYDYLIDYTYKTYPVPAIIFSTHAAVTYNGPCNGSGVPKPSSLDWDNLSGPNMLDLITNVWQAEGSPNIYYYGLLHLDCGSSCITGIGWIGGPHAAVGFDGFDSLHSGASETHAHEVGHNHGRMHAPVNPSDPTCIVPDQIDPSYPYANGVIGDAAHQNFGFDIVSPAVQPYYLPYYDIMNYCPTRWISDYTYQGIWRYDNTRLAGRSTQPIDDRAFLISGAIDPQTDRVTFNPVYAIALPAYQPERGDYFLDMLNARRQVVATYPFVAVSATPDRIGAATAVEQTIGFHLSLPYRDDVAALRVRRGTIALGTLNASAAAPLLWPTPSTHGISRAGQITWSGYSTGTAPLTYLVRASADGGQTWQTIGIDLAAPAITLNPADFGGKTVRLEVIGSNGLKSSTLSLGPYQMPQE